MFRYLCEDCVFPEKKFQPAVRKLATNLLLSGEIEDNKEYTCLIILRPASSLHHHHHVCLFQVNSALTKPSRPTCRRTFCLRCAGWRL